MRAAQPTDDIFEFGEPIRQPVRSRKKKRRAPPPPPPRNGLGFLFTIASFAFICAGGFGLGSIAQAMIIEVGAPKEIVIAKVERDFSF